MFSFVFYISLGQTLKISISLHYQICFNTKFYPEARRLRKNENCDKTAHNAKNTIFTRITALIPLWYEEANHFRPFLPYFSQ